MYKFNNKYKCERCEKLFSQKNRRIQSWFNDEVICSETCSGIEQLILEKLGANKYLFEDCGFIPN